jgi:hypothetical protein
MQSKKSKIILALVALVVMIKFGMSFWGGPPPIDIPEEVYGKWTTTNADYADRYFELSETTVTFGLGADGIAVYSVEEIQGLQTDDRVIYKVIFRDDQGTEYSQSIFFSDDDPDGLRFKNQKEIIWHKQAE